MVLFGSLIDFDRLIRKMPSSLREAINLSWATLSPNIKWLAWFGILSHPLYLVLNTLLANGSEAPFLRFLSVAGCLCVLSIRDTKQHNAPSGAAILSLLIVFFVLPFFFFWVLIQNALSLDTSDLQLASRQIQCAFSIMAISLLIYDARLLIIGTVGSFVFAVLLSIGQIEAETLPRLIDGVFSQIPFWIFALIGGVYFNRNRVVVEKEKLKTLSAVGGHLAHELRTPLATIGIKMNGTLMSTSHLTESEVDSDSKAELRKHILEMRKICSAVVSDTRYANSLIDMFLVRAGMHDMKGYEDSRFKVMTCVSEALDRYPFQGERERSLVEVRVLADYEVNGPYILFMHVILNLLKNSFSYIQMRAEPAVEIRAEYLDGRGKLSVVDNGSGIERKNLDRVFSSFFTTSSAGEGAGVGLNFCQKVVQDIGGTLTVTSVPYVETIFTLDIPAEISS